MARTIPLLCCFVFLARLPVSHAQDETVDELTEQVEALENERGTRIEALREEYAMLESLHASLDGEPGEAVVQAIAAALEDARNELALPAGERSTRGFASIRRDIRRRLEDGSHVPPALVDPIAVALTRSYSEDPSGLASRDRISEWCRAALRQTMSPERPFHEIWNLQLYEQSPAAIVWREANGQLDDVRARLDRLLNPSAGDPDAPKGMVKIPGGTYEVGPDAGWERNARRVSLRAFYIDVLEVTNADYKAFWDQLEDEDEKEDHRPRYWIRSGGTWDVPKGRLQHPVTGVTWPAAAAYASWAGKRLPTEDEWQVAARGKDLRRYPWGDVFDSRRCNSSTSAREDTVIVGTLPDGASPFGCQDMAGNVEEWTASLRDGKVLRREPRLLQDQVVVRGGGFHSRPEELATNWRWVYPPGTTQPYLGFRCVRDAR